MNALIWSLVAIAVAPALERVMARWPWLSSAADALAAVVVLATVLLHTLPYALGELGGLAVLVAAAGLLVPPLCEVSSPRLLGTVVVAGLGAHALVDGAMLAAPEDADAGHVLAEAIAIHTVPVSLAIWRAALPHGVRVGVGLLALTAAAELLGWFGARTLLDSSGNILALLQCFTAGTLLHFAWASTPQSPRGSALGVAVGVAIAWSMTHSHPMPGRALGELNALPTFLGLCLSAAPGLLAALLLSGLLPRGRSGGDPVLSVGLYAVALALPLLGLWHGVAAAVGAMGIALLQGRRARSLAPEALSLATLREGVDAHLGWALLGLGAGAMLEPLLGLDALSGTLGLGVTLGGLALGLLVPASVAGLVPVVAVLDHKGLLPGAGVALVLAPAAGAALGLGAVAGGRGALFAWRRGLLAASGLLILGWAVSALAPTWLASPLHPLIEGPTGPAAWITLACASALTLDALLRRGSPGLLPPLLRGHSHAHGHDHDHDHRHDHEALA